VMYLSNCDLATPGSPIKQTLISPRTRRESASWERTQTCTLDSPTRSPPRSTGTRITGITHQADVDISSNLHPVSDRFRHSSDEQQEQCLFHILVPVDLGGDRVGESRVQPYTGFKAIRAGLLQDTFLEAMHVHQLKKQYLGVVPHGSP
jgi:hypothetical protein